MERTFGWLNRYRRLAKDDERSLDSSEAMIYLAMIRLMLARLAQKPQAKPRQSDQASTTPSALAASFFYRLLASTPRFPPENTSGL